MSIKYSWNDVNNKNRLSKFFHYQKRSEFRKYSMNASKDAKPESSSITQDWINCIKHIKSLSNYTEWAKHSDDLQCLPFFSGYFEFEMSLPRIELVCRFQSETSIFTVNLIFWQNNEWLIRFYIFCWSILRFICWSRFNSHVYET